MAKLRPKQTVKYQRPPEGDAAFAVAVFVLTTLSVVIALMVLLEILQTAPVMAALTVGLSVVAFGLVVMRAVRDRAQATPKNLAVNPPVLRLKQRRQRSARPRLANQAH